MHLAIGDNVFIGMNSNILRGVTIGNDVMELVVLLQVIVNRDGFMRVILRRKLYRLKNILRKDKGAQLEEAKALYSSYKDRFGVNPTRDVFMLFESIQSLIEQEKEKLKLCGNYEQSIRYLNGHAGTFSTFEDFSEWCNSDWSYRKLL